MKRTLLLILLLLIALSVITNLHSSRLESLDPGIGKRIVDSHVHVAGLGYGDSGCFINREMRENYRLPFFLWAMDVTEEELQQHGDQLLLERLSQKIAASETVDKAVLLAMDGYVTEEGELLREQTQVYVPNDYLARESAKYDNLLFGASVNPNRKDAIARLHQVKRDGALLIKWIPSIMNIDPSDPRHTAFYQTMAELGLPLLSHTGMERSFPEARNELTDPLRLKLPLELGVTVIAAHIATTGKSEGEDNFSRIMPMFRDYPNLYTDISSLTQINKLDYLAEALESEIVRSRMLYGSDWPLQFFPLVSPWYHLDHLSLEHAWEVSGIGNPWDRDVALKQAMGVPEAVFRRSGELLQHGR